MPRPESLLVLRVLGMPHPKLGTSKQQGVARRRETILNKGEAEHPSNRGKVHGVRGVVVRGVHFEHLV